MNKTKRNIRHVNQIRNLLAAIENTLIQLESIASHLPGSDNLNIQLQNVKRTCFGKLHDLVGTRKINLYEEFKAEKRRS